MSANESSTPIDTTSSLYNEDLAPTAESQRTWGTWDIAALWVGMSVCITTYFLASGMIEQGMSWWQAGITVLLGNVIVLVPMVLNAVPGTKYGIPFPVLLRSSFGTKGANIPAIMRGIVACGWFGIQTWVGGSAIYTLFFSLIGKTPEPVALPVIGISFGQLFCFFLFWVMNVAIIVKGMGWIKWLEKLSAPFLIVGGLVLLWWAWSKAGTQAIFANKGTLQGWQFWKVFIPNLTAVVGYWATLSLNIPDFSRYAKSQKSQILGQTIGLPSTMTLFALIGILVTAATVTLYGEAIWDPVALFARFDRGVAVVIALVGLTIATLSTNIAANVVSPANDIANLLPRKISFKMGGVIAAVIGAFILPWKLIESTQGYIFTWMIGYSALLGPIAGIMIADFFVRRRQVLDVQALYDPAGIYSYRGGFNLLALAVFFLAALPNVPGFINAATGKAIFPGFFDTIYLFAWFIGFFLAAGLYVVAMKAMHGRAPEAS
ncbi:MAG: NCS1 family nucleobase:cation symporter-1 [Sumerlaeia bacterium]